MRLMKHTLYVEPDTAAVSNRSRDAAVVLLRHARH